MVEEVDHAVEGEQPAREEGQFVEAAAVAVVVEVEGEVVHVEEPDPVVFRYWKKVNLTLILLVTLLS